MQNLVKRYLILGALTAAICVAPAFAQEYELHPYAGGEWMSNFHALSFKNPAVLGLKGGAYLTDRVMIEGNLGWMNQFNFSG